MMDLSMKSKEKSLSLRNLKDKSNTLKQSLGDKLKILQKSRKSKYAGENQVNFETLNLNNFNCKLYICSFTIILFVIL